MEGVQIGRLACRRVGLLAVPAEFGDDPRGFEEGRWQS
jgi:hypothetical protein